MMAGSFLRRLILGTALFALVAIMIGTGAVKAGSQIALTWELQALDLDSGAVVGAELSPDPFLDYPQADIILAYNAVRIPHAVVMQNPLTAVEMAFLAGVPFENVSAADIAGLVFTQEVVDRPFSSGDTVVLRTDAGAIYKLGHPLEDDWGVTLEYEQLQAAPAAFPLLAGDKGSARADGPEKADGRPASNSPASPGRAAPATLRQFQAQREHAPFQVEALEDGAVAASNPEHELLAIFDADGAKLSPLDQPDSTWEWGLQLSGYGYAGALRPVEAAEPVAFGNRVEYRRGELVEWYVNDNRGLEQGFTLQAPPALEAAAASTGPDLSVAMVVRLGSLALVLVAGITYLAAARRQLTGRSKGQAYWLSHGRKMPSLAYMVPVLLALLLASPLSSMLDRFGQAPLILQLALGGTLRPQLNRDGQEAVLAHPSNGTPVLRYTGLKAWDANGHPVSARMTLADTGMELQVDDGGAVYPITIDPTVITEEAKLTAADQTPYKYLGYSTAISSDVAVLGAPLDSTTDQFSGAAYVFRRSGSSWSQEAKLLASDGARNDQFGISVAVDGETIVVGAYDHDHQGITNSGGVYVFTYDGVNMEWVEQTELLTADPPLAANWYGLDVSVGENTVVAGAPHTRGATGRIEGAAYVFERTGASWSAAFELMASDVAPLGQFGYSLAVSGDRLLIGAPGDDDKGLSSGSAYVFARDGSAWIEQAKLVASDGSTGDFFGRWAVDLSGDSAVVGVAYESDSARWAGAAYVYTYDGTIWSEEAKLVASDTSAGDLFGAGGSIEGDFIAIGAHGHVLYQGSAYLFKRSGTTWREQAQFLASDRAFGDWLGYSVDLSGSRVVAGAFLKEENGLDRAGAAYIFAFTLANQPPVLTVDESSVTVDEGSVAVNGGTVVDADGDAVTLSASLGTAIDKGGAWSWSFGSRNGPEESQSVLITAEDSNGAASSASFQLTVNNLPPDVGVIDAPLVPVPVDTSVATSVSFSDPGLEDSHMAIWDWGDGSISAGTVIEANGSGGVTGAHTYTGPGIYTVGVMVTDDDGGVGQATFQYVVIYDPDGGFVTGGGWIDSPPGAFRPDPSLTGRANFGFVSKYKKGTTAPTGQTEFQFQVADLNFHSDSYDWLVVAGSTAKFKGGGTINGSGNYGFMITVTDAALTASTEEDLFRIKIWDKDNGDTVVYDNQPGARDDSYDGTALEGGSIVIHP